MSRILIADDDECLRELLVRKLSKDGYYVTAAADGEEAWDDLEHARFDLLVTDNEMPRLTGVGLIERIRHADMTIPVVLASGSFSLEQARRRPELHVAAVLNKPFTLQDLSEVVRNALRGEGEPASASQEGSNPFDPKQQPIGNHN